MNRLISFKSFISFFVCFSMISSFVYAQSGVNYQQLTKKQWMEDIDFFATKLPKKHLNAFHRISKEEFDRQVNDLRRDVDHLDNDEIYFRLFAIAQSIGDLHTRLSTPDNLAFLPIVIRKFDNDFRVINIKPGYENALGAKVSKINGMPIAEVCNRLSKIVPPFINPSLEPLILASYMRVGIFLHGAGITAERQLAQYTLLTDEGKELSLDLRSDTSSNPEPLARMSKVQLLIGQEPLNKFWIKYLPEQKALYCNVREIKHLRKPSKKMLDMIKLYQPEKLIIDLRQNGGGDYFKGLRYLVNPIQKLPSVNKKGHLYILISPITGSAAMANTTHFRSKTEAILVGQALGEKPNGYAELRSVKLPNSKLTLSYSVKFYTFVEGENIVRPDIEINPTLNDVKAGVDPVMEWVLKQP